MMRVTALGRDWSWPDNDDECRKVVFGWAVDLDIAYQHCKAFDVAVQAGGNMGTWPWLMSKKFGFVHTFEPDPACIPHLKANLEGVENVCIYEAGLGFRETVCSLKNNNPRNMGSQYAEFGTGNIPVTHIDGLGLKACDLIYLDIEGAELRALQGAYDTIAKFGPCIVVEDKKLSRRFGSEKGDIEKWLSHEFGYCVVARPHRDVVMVC